MADRTLNVKVLNVTKTTEQWGAVESAIPKGLLCVELSTEGKVLIKIGNGVSTFAQLPYVTDGSFSISDYSTTTQTETMISDAIKALGNVVRVKGVKATVEELPSEGNEVGDLWFVGTAGETSDSFSEYVWTTEGKWEFVGKTAGTIDLTDYAKTAYVDGEITKLSDRIEALEKAPAYELPIASATTLGGIKIGEDLQISDDGVVTTNIGEATAEKAGLMSAADKKALDAVNEYDLSKFISVDDNLTLNCEI